MTVNKTIFLLPLIGLYLQGRWSPTAHHLHPMMKIKVVSSLSWAHHMVEDWSGRWLLPTSPMHFGQLYHRSINGEKLCCHLTHWATPGSILTLPQTRHCPIYGNSSPVTISFYYYWLLNKSCVRQEGKHFSVLTLFCSKTYKEEGSLLYSSEVSINFWSLISSWLLVKRKCLSYFLPREKDSSWRWVMPAGTPCVVRKPKRAFWYEGGGWRPGSAHFRGLVQSASEAEAGRRGEKNSLLICW